MSQKKILIIDDDPVARDVVARILNDAGYDFLTASDGSQGVHIARQEKLDLILLDILFPPDVAHGGGIGWDGFLIMDWLRRLDGVQDIPIFFMTQGDAAEYRTRAFAKGAGALFQKPLNPEELLTAIRNTIGEAGTVAGDTVHINLGR